MNQYASDYVPFDVEDKSAPAETLKRTTQQVGLAGGGLEAIDRCLGLRGCDILLCETTCLSYAKHVLYLKGRVRELWLVPPQSVLGRVPNESLDNLITVLNGVLTDELVSAGDDVEVFKGVTSSLPSEPFKLLITAQFDGDPGFSALEWPSKCSELWSGMLRTEGASGAVIYPRRDDRAELQPVLRMDLSAGARYPEGFVRAAELPGGHVVLATGEPTGAFHMEDVADVDDPWAFDATTIDLVLNDGCLTPSVFRSGVQALGVMSLGELSSRISRGTTLSEKDLDIKAAPSFSPESTFGFGEAIYKMSYGQGLPPSSGEFYRYPGVLYYIDGGCFQNGVIRPKVLNSMPEGQGSYIVDGDDGEVLLVARSSKEVAVYKSVSRPTLIGNSVFVVRIGNDVTLDYLACWMRGSFAKAWLRTGGRRLTKKVLASLPVPILDEEAMEQTVRYERTIDERIFMLYQEIGSLKATNRFNPLNAAKQERSARSENESLVKE